jgi:hypothetical protein
MRLHSPASFLNNGFVVYPGFPAIVTSELTLTSDTVAMGLHLTAALDSRSRPSIAIAVVWQSA